MKFRMEKGQSFKVELSDNDRMEVIKATYTGPSKIVHAARYRQIYVDLNLWVGQAPSKSDFFVEPSLYLRITCDTDPCVGYFVCIFPKQDI